MSRYNYARELIAESFVGRQAAAGKIGGIGKVVQIDETKIGKRKYNRGRMVEGHWVIGNNII